MNHPTPRRLLSPATAALLSAALTAGAGAESLVSSGVPYHNDEPFFGVGYYDADARPGEQKMASIRKLAGAGFNVMLLL